MKLQNEVSINFAWTYCYSFLPSGISINFPKLVIHNVDIVIGTKYLIKLKWWIRCSSNSLCFRRWTAKLLIICVCVLSCSIFVLQNKVTELSAILKQKQNDNTPRLVSRQKRGLERGQLQSNCPLIVWQNQGNFMQSVITNHTIPNYEIESTTQPSRYGGIQPWLSENDAVTTAKIFLRLRLQLQGAIYRPDSFVMMPRFYANLKAIRHESTSLNRILADKSHRVIVA